MIIESKQNAQRCASTRHDLHDTIYQNWFNSWTELSVMLTLSISNIIFSFMKDSPTPACLPEHCNLFIYLFLLFYQFFFYSSFSAPEG